ncbi:MAG TPA: sulfotransferase [Fimbriimonas sp.]|nr:sulfotransferase [Fimbriimonas sp.]
MNASEDLLRRASVAQSQGQIAEARSICEQVLAKEPENIQARLLLGVVEAYSSHAQAALGLLAEVEQNDPSSFQAPFWLSVAYRQLGSLEQALHAAERARRVNPNELQGQVQLAMCLLDARYLRQAETLLQSAARAAPNALKIHCSLSRCLFMQGRRADASFVLRSALDRTRVPLETLLSVGTSLLAQEFPFGAKECGRRAVGTAPSSPAAHLLLGRALVETDGNESIQHLGKASQLDPMNAEALSLWGTAAQTLGHLQQAAELYHESQRKDPNQGYAYFAHFSIRRVTEADRSRIELMQALAKQELAPRQLSYLHYGLGKAFEDLRQFGDAMDHYDEANRIEYALKFGDREFDADEYSAKTDRTMFRFDRDTFAAAEGTGSPSELPIFVVGMMRSGTTLVEQILSSHPSIGGAGEQPFWPDNWREAMDGELIVRENVSGLGARYVNLLKEIAPGKQRVVDKQPANTHGLGLIHLALPKAKVIHIRRDPVDTCLSIYATPNRARSEFAHRKENIVVAYREYLRVMEHWRSELPSGTMLEIQYEDLVARGEDVIRRMVEFCAVEWSDRCLRPEENVRSVVTPSAWQVRQPIYQTSTQRWHGFEPYLGAFAELMKTDAEM